MALLNYRNKHTIVCQAYESTKRVYFNEVATRKKNPAAVALAKLRTEKLSPERRTEIATNAGKKRASVLSTAALSDIGRRGGLVGGKARAAKLTKEQRSAIARKAAAARWSKET